jgi:hypothetical protein
MITGPFVGTGTASNMNRPAFGAVVVVETNEPPPSTNVKVRMKAAVRTTVSP